MEKNVINTTAFSNELDSLVCNFLFEIAMFLKQNGKECENPNLQKIDFPKDVKIIEGGVSYIFINNLSNETYAYLRKPNKAYEDENIGNLSAESILKIAENINKVVE